MFKIEHITASLGEKDIRTDVSLTVHAGHALIMGPTGEREVYIFQCLIGSALHYTLFRIPKGKRHRYNSMEMSFISCNSREGEGIFLAFQSPSVYSGRECHASPSFFISGDLSSHEKKSEENLGNAIFQEPGKLRV